MTFTWPHLKATVKEFIRECDICQLCKANSTKPVGLLQPLPIPTQIWTEISIDFIYGLSPSHGHAVIMVVVDCLSKYTHFISLKYPYMASLIAKVFGANSIVSDRDKVFLSTFGKPCSITWYHIKVEFKLSSTDKRIKGGAESNTCVALLANFQING